MWCSDTDSTPTTKADESGPLAFTAPMRHAITFQEYCVFLTINNKSFIQQEAASCRLQDSKISKLWIAGWPGKHCWEKASVPNVTSQRADFQSCVIFTGWCCGGEAVGEKDVPFSLLESSLAEQTRLLYWYHW